MVFITASYGLGEAIIQGIVNPDEFYVFKPTLSQGKPAIIKRSLGSKLVQIQYAESHDIQHSVATHDVPTAQQSCFSITDEEAEELARQALTIEPKFLS